MDGQVVECVPNFSEGTDARRVEAIIAAMRMEGVRLLDWSMDAAHNRSVVTLAGDPAAIVEAAIRGVGKAVELIDLTRQQGAHPRIGAADVIPFVPISGIKLEHCALLARQAGLEIWRRFGVPVFFYEAAAARPDRANLEDVRRGQFEGLKEAVRKESTRRPDLCGPGLHPTAGACSPSRCRWRAENRPGGGSQGERRSQSLCAPRPPRFRPSESPPTATPRSPMASDRARAPSRSPGTRG